MSVLTLALLDQIKEKILNTKYKPPKLFISPKMWEKIEELQKWENWVRTLSPRKEKQERLKHWMKDRKGIYNYKLPLPD